MGGYESSPEKNTNKIDLRAPVCASGLYGVPCEGGEMGSMDGTPQQWDAHENRDP